MKDICHSGPPVFGIRTTREHACTVYKYDTYCCAYARMLITTENRLSARATRWQLDPVRRIWICCEEVTVGHGVWCVEELLVTALMFIRIT
ncbi:hypothetical protein BDV96DRAFT_585403 [Lophiotrema nucula]|uniref:Uncharacterized protein n=1 Tax=Lophiotrema nucula TaxID=690887 RepID=A0A6A5YQP9_9PLEO|nr:hypothetical protein BDV96DRAFT_585403 [Lophiotrema nucula]